MALYRQIFIEFWKDPKVTEEMSAEDRYTLLYLLTNPHTTQIGIYQITKRQIAFDLGYSTESVGAILERFEKLLGLIKYNSETREIAIKNWGKYNLKRGGKPVLDCIKGELAKVKDKTLIEYVAKSIPNESIKELFLRNVNVTPTWSGQEEEQEEEKEEEQEEEKEERNVVVDEIKKAFNSFDDKTIKSIEDSFKKKGKDINYLLEKIDITKKANTNNAAGYLISAITNDYKSSINNAKCFIPQVKTRYHNINQTFMNYGEDELERLLKESQKGKFQ